MPPRILTVVGTRPQFVKAAVVSRAIRSAGSLTEILVHTGQHSDPNMSNVFFEELEIPAPKHDLAVNGLDRAAVIGRTVKGLEEVMAAEKPEAILVYGDSNSTLAGALAAAKVHIPLAHVEAGLRSFNREMPEEINRIITDNLSAVLFCPTLAAIGHLAHEGITQGVSHVGDVMFDATLRARETSFRRSSVLETLGLAPRSYAVATVHRAESTDDPERLRSMMAYLEKAATQQPIVFPIHPRTRAALAGIGLRAANLRIVEPLGYLDMHRLLADALTIFTDSGGLQKEAYFHRVPCVTLRDETEWIETIACGWNRLWTVDRYEPRCEIDDYGDGHASDTIVTRLGAWLG